MKKKLLSLFALLFLVSCQNLETPSSTLISSSEDVSNSSSSVETGNITHAMLNNLSEGVSLEGTILYQRQSGNEIFKDVYTLSLSYSQGSYARFTLQGKPKANMTLPNTFSLEDYQNEEAAFEEGETIEELNVIPSETGKQDDNGNPYAVQAVLGLDNVVHESLLSFTDSNNKTVHPVYAESGFSSSYFSSISLAAMDEDTSFSSDHYAYVLYDYNCSEKELAPISLLADSFSFSYGSTPFDEVIFLTDGTKITDILAKAEDTVDSVTTTYYYLLKVTSSGKDTIVPKATPISGTTYSELDAAYGKLENGNFTEVDECGLYVTSSSNPTFIPTRKLTMTVSEESILYMPYIYSSSISDYYQGIGNGYLLYDGGMMEKATPLSKGYYLHGEKFKGNFTFPKLSSVFFTRGEDGHYTMSYSDARFHHIFLDTKSTYYLMSMTAYGTESLDIEVSADKIVTISYDETERVTSTYTDIGSTTPAFKASDVNRNSDSLTWKDMVYSRQYPSLQSLFGSDDNLNLVPTLGGVFSEVSLISATKGTTTSTFRIEYPLLTQSLSNNYLSSLIQQYKARVEADTDYTISHYYNHALNSSDSYYLVEASYSNPITVGEDSYSLFLQGGYTTSSGHHSGYCFAIIGTLTKIV